MMSDLFPNSYENLAQLKIIVTIFSDIPKFYILGKGANFKTHAFLS